MSKNSFLSCSCAPFCGEKRCKIITDFDTDQIFLRFFSVKVINNLPFFLLITHLKTYTSIIYIAIKKKQKK